MGNIIPIRVVYTRIGEQEQWGGWRIAGFTPNVTPEALNYCTAQQGKNSFSAKLMYDRINPNTGESDKSAENVYEFSCADPSGKKAVFSFSKMQFGTLDGLGRAQMKANSIVLSQTAKLEVSKCPQQLLLIDRSCFDDCALDESLFENTSGKTRSLTDVQTVLESKNYTYTEDFSVEKMVDRYFSSREIYEEFMRCVYWNLSFSSSSSIHICIDGGLDDFINLFLIAFLSVIYPYRTAMSFRTYDFEDASNQTTFVFSKQISDNVRYFDPKTGDNNIMTDKVRSKVNRKAFNYFPHHLGEPGSEDYFEKLDKKMDSMGVRFSTAIRDLESIAGLVTDDMDGVSGQKSQEQSDKEILKSIISYCNMPQSNELDLKIAQLIEHVIESDIPMNDDIYRHINNRMAKTECEELIRSGNHLYAKSLLLMEEQYAFKHLRDLYRESKRFDEVAESLLKQNGGRNLLDEFYVKEICPSLDPVQDKVTALFDEIAQFGYLPKTLKCVDELCDDIGRGINTQFFKDGASIAHAWSEYNHFLNYIFDGRQLEKQQTIDRIKIDFWDRFTFDKFTYDNKVSYTTVACSDFRKYPSEVIIKSNFTAKLFDVFSTAEKQNANTVRSFSNRLKEAAFLSAPEKRHLILEFQRYCLDNCTQKGRLIDFWNALAYLDKSKWIDFLFRKRIDLFLDEELYRAALSESVELKKLPFLEEYLDYLEFYYKSHVSKTVYAVLEATKEYKAALDKKGRSNKGDRLPKTVKTTSVKSSQRTANHHERESAHNSSDEIWSNSDHSVSGVRVKDNKSKDDKKAGSKSGFGKRLSSLFNKGK